MRYLMIFIRLLFLPVWLLAKLIYPDCCKSEPLITYAWFTSKKDYDAVVHPDANKAGDVLSYDEWKMQALDDIALYHRTGLNYIKVRIRPNTYHQWRKMLRLPNTVNTRELYISNVCDQVMEDGIEPTYLPALTPAQKELETCH